MKQIFTPALILVFVSLTFFSCSDLLEEFGRTGKVKKHLLKEFSYNNRHYELTYNADGNVTRVRAYEDGMEYFYNVAYIGTQIDSVTLIDGSDYISTNKNYVYDKEGKILSYSNFLTIPDVPGQSFTFETPYTLTYDSKDRLISINGIFDDQFGYDNQRNITTWNRDGSNLQTFTYDKGRNPLAQVPDLFTILVEEPFFWEYLFSEQNSVTKTTSDNVTTTYTNVYDKKKRLLTKTGMTQGETTDQFAFTYY